MNSTGAIGSAGILGATKLLINNCAVLRREGNIIYLALDSRSESLLTKERQQLVAEALSAHFGETLRVDVSLGSAQAETPVQEVVRLEDEALHAARVALESDPNVQVLKDMFGATLNSDSIQIINDQSTGNQE